MKKMFNKSKTCKLSQEQVNKQASDLINKLTLKEKIWMLHGNWNLLSNIFRYRNFYNPVAIETTGCERLGISPIKFSDGPRGIVMGRSTCFPVSMARGASFNRNLEQKIGNVIGKEARAQDSNYFGGVCINLLRHPAWGRAQETYGEDPFHVGEMGKSLTISVQDHNVIACLKHYAVNNIENSRFRVNVKTDERTLREVYLPHFKKSIDAGAASVMGAYNLFDGDQCCESDFLLNQVLREDWGFNGFTISDFFFGIRDGVKAIKSGMDIEMPLPIYYQKNLLKAVDEGELEESIIDQSVSRIIKTLLVFENCPDPTSYPRKIIASKEHIGLAQKAAEESMVLLKNENDVLPLSKDIKRLLVVGRLAKQANLGDNGSSKINPPFSTTPWDGLREYLGAKVKIEYCDEKYLHKAKKQAAKVDAVIIIAGYDYKDEGEAITPDSKSNVSYDLIAKGIYNQGKRIWAFIVKLTTNTTMKMFNLTQKDGTTVGGDRESLTLKPEMETLIESIADINKKTIVSLVSGSMVITEKWNDSVASIIYSWYSGMKGGTALARLLFGDVNPSGKLPFVQPTSAEHLPYFSNEDDDIIYDLYHGYTLLDKNNIEPAYYFGHGLSYTKFKFENVELQKQNNKINIKVSLSNIGSQDGAEVVQVYVSVKNSSIERQKKLLKGFEKVFLAKGETKKIEINVDIDELKYFDLSTKSWLLEKTVYKFKVGGSSDPKQLISKELLIGS